VDNDIRILLVEDELLITLSLQDALAEGGYTVELASNGKEALSRIAGGRAWSGLVTDIRLGSGPDGWHIARTAREANPNIAIVYISGDSAADYSSHGVPDSVMLQKPFAPAQLVTALSSCLNRVIGHPPE
jgi:CheY-like chemotaxis protein